MLAVRVFRNEQPKLYTLTFSVAHSQAKVQSHILVSSIFYEGTFDPGLRFIP
jgi:hypothetical protein